MKNQLQNIVFLIILLFVFACNKEKENNVVFEKETPVKEDATKSYLHKVENYKKDKNYLPTLYKYYNQKIAERNYLKAAEDLDIACIYLADSYDFNDVFMSTIKKFDAEYRKELPALKTTFVDAYLANYYFDKSN